MSVDEVSDPPSVPEIREKIIEYQGKDGLMTVIQDPKNTEAWVESTHIVEVER